jgi:ribosomal protein S18 acetylase RimI-like enzyme
MITLCRITSPQSTAYALAEQLLTASFPREEYRELTDWRTFAATRTRFHLTLANEVPALLTYWDFDRFVYVEHLAVAAALRSQGYGSQMLSALKAEVGERPIVLEVERPEDEVARRRIAFYERNGFRRWTERAYRQPPYRKGDAPIDMWLMACGPLPETCFDEVVECIYQEVYDTNFLRNRDND